MLATQTSIPRLRFAVVPDDITRALELQKGSADVAINALEPDTVHALRSNPRLEIQTTPGTIVNYINLNLPRPISPRCPRPPGYRDGDQSPCSSSTPSGEDRPDSPKIFFHPTTGRGPMTSPTILRSGKGQRPLDAAGYQRGNDGIRFHLEIKTSNTSSPTRLMALVVQQHLRDVGIAMDVRIFEFATFFADVTKGAFRMYALRWIGGNESPDIFRHAYATASLPPHGANRGHYINPELDALMADAAASTDRARDRADYVKVQQIVAATCPPSRSGTRTTWSCTPIACRTSRSQHRAATTSSRPPRCALNTCKP